MINWLLSWENLAVALAVTYLLLAMRENIWCWYAAFISTLIFTVLFWNVSLPMQSLLNLYYMAMAVYGWWQWKKGGAEHEGIAIHRWSSARHAVAIGTVVLISLASGWYLSANTETFWPYISSLTTWGSVLCTWMVARKVLENWLYWLVVDCVAIFIYLERELYSTVGLFVIYIVIAFVGYFQWVKLYRQQAVAEETANA